MIINVFCKCGCGRQTGIRDIPSGCNTANRFFGVITGHKAPLELITDQTIARQREAEYIVKTLCS